MIYVFKGNAKIGGSKVPQGSIVRLKADDAQKRLIEVIAEDEGTACLLFAGKRLDEPIAWHGPFVMNTQEEIHRTMDEYYEGRFLKKRAKWNFKRAEEMPHDEEKSNIDKT